MLQDTTYQIRIDEDTKAKAFEVFRELGMKPADGIRMFLRAVSNTRAIPFPIWLQDTPQTQEKEAGYDEWLRARLEKTMLELRTGEMKTYTTDEVRANLKTRSDERRAKMFSPSKA